MKTHFQDKKGLVNSVFNKVHKKYDFMNDLMSFGIHRLWKKNMVDWLSPQKKNETIGCCFRYRRLSKDFF